MLPFCRTAFHCENSPHHPTAQPSNRPTIQPNQERDPVAVIAADPGSLIDMEAAGMPSTLEFN